MRATTTTTTTLLLIAITLLLLTPSLAQKNRFVSERKARLSDPITDTLGLALKVGFHSGCSGCLAAEDGFNWCVHPDNDGVGACVPGDCSEYNYYSIFNVEDNSKRAFNLDTNFKDGAYICNKEREPEFRTRSKSRVVYGVQASNAVEGDAFGEISAFSYATQGAYYSDVNTYSHGVISHFCNLPEGTVIDRTQGGPDFLINAGYEHCLMANSELSELHERECSPESKCFVDNVLFGGGTKRNFFAFVSSLSRFYPYQCAQLLALSEEQREHYNWILASMRSVTCANDCHSYGIPTSGICQHACTRINEAFTNYALNYEGDFDFGPEALESQFNFVPGEGDDEGGFEWEMAKYICVPDNTPSCKHVDLYAGVTDHFRSRISPNSLTSEEKEFCFEFGFFDD